jgi:AcrR family transcriptional regulator
MAVGEVDVATLATSASGRGRILGAARALFTTQGFAAVSMQQIADAAAVNKATLYHHFRDKEDLFASVMMEEFARMAAGMEAAVAGGGTLAEQLQRVAAHILAARRSDFGRLVADLHMHVSEERRLALMGRSQPPWEQLKRIFAQAVATGEVRPLDPELMARTFFAMVGSQVWWAKFGDGQLEPDDRLAALLTDLLLFGIANEP